MIELRNVTRSYRVGSETMQVLRGISLNIDEGEFVSITGPSGSGKSTLLCIMGCLDSPTSGQMILAGYDVSKLNDDQLAHIRNRTIGFVFQTFNLLAYYDALENVLLPTIYKRTKKTPEEIRSRGKELLHRVGLGHRIHHRPNQMSGGERQRVAIARALINGPKIIFADEPTGALDSKTGEEIMAILQGLNREGVTLIMVTHDPKIASRARKSLQIMDGLLFKERQGLF